MNKQKIMKWALPALMMSALMFESMPGSVRYLEIQIPEQAMAYHFFNLQSQDVAANCLTLAGYVTIVGVILALIAAFSKKHPIFNAVAWCSLVAAALTAVPYMQPEELLWQPNVIITIILTVCWLIAFLLDKKTKAPEGTDANPRL